MSHFLNFEIWHRQHETKNNNKFLAYFHYNTFSFFLSKLLFFFLLPSGEPIHLVKQLHGLFWIFQILCSFREAKQKQKNAEKIKKRSKKEEKQKILFSAHFLLQPMYHSASLAVLSKKRELFRKFLRKKRNKFSSRNIDSQTWTSGDFRSQKKKVITSVE